MGQEVNETVQMPLGLPAQIGGLPTAKSDLGDDTQERFRYNAETVTGSLMLVRICEPLQRN